MEALRLRACPGVYFADEPAGREAKAAGTGPGVREVIRDCLAEEKHEARVREGLVGLSSAQLRAALEYDRRHPDEIDAAMEDNRASSAPGA